MADKAIEAQFARSKQVKELKTAALMISTLSNLLNLLMVCYMWQIITTKRTNNSTRASRQAMLNQYSIIWLTSLSILLMDLDLLGLLMQLI